MNHMRRSIRLLHEQHQATRPQVLRRPDTCDRRQDERHQAAHQAGIVDEAVTEERVLPRAIEMAAALAGKDPETLATIKRSMYGPVIEALSGPAWA